MTFGTSRVNAYKLIEDALNLKEIKVFDQMLNPYMYGLEKVEVLKSPLSTFNGAESLSGVINM